MQTLIEQGLSGAFGVVSLPLLVVLFIILIGKALRVLAGIVGIVFILALIYVVSTYFPEYGFSSINDLIN